MSHEVAGRIRTLVRERGPITFAEYMGEALYGPGGFYEATPVGVGGHFVTSPHVHPIFSRLVGAAVEDLWNGVGRPKPLRLVEPGAGDGTMGRELTDGFARARIDLDYVAVEISPGARAALEALGIRAVERLSDLEALDPGVVVANELLDNLPFRRVRNRAGDLLEVRIGVEDGRLVEVTVPCDDALRSIAPSVEPGAEAAVPTGTLALVDELASWMLAGYAILVDYGSDTRPAAEVHGYREHRLVEDVLSDPGSADITAGVDLHAVIGRAAARGLMCFGPVRQSSALRALGLEDWLRQERSRQQEALGARRGLDAVRARDGRSRAGILVDPTALGRLRWIVLATPGLPEPGWLARARTFEPAVD